MKKIKANITSFTTLVFLVFSSIGSPAQSNTFKLGKKKMLASDTSEVWVAT
jgi:hypothetical protein